VTATFQSLPEKFFWRLPAAGTTGATSCSPRREGRRSRWRILGDLSAASSRRVRCSVPVRSVGVGRLGCVVGVGPESLLHGVAEFWAFVVLALWRAGSFSTNCFHGQLSAEGQLRTSPSVRHRAAFSKASMRRATPRRRAAAERRPPTVCLARGSFAIDPCIGSRSHRSGRWFPVVVTDASGQIASSALAERWSSFPGRSRQNDFAGFRQKRWRCLLATG